MIDLSRPMEILLSFVSLLPTWADSFFVLLGQLAAALAAVGSIYKFAVLPMIVTFRRISAMYDRVESLVKQMERNGGATLRDSLDRIERMIYLLDERQKILLGMVPYGIVETDQKGKVIYVNRTYLQWTGRSTTEILGEGWSNCVVPEDRERLKKEWVEAVNEQRAYEGRFRMIDQEGHPFQVSAKAVPMYAEMEVPPAVSPPNLQPLGWLAIIQRCDLELCAQAGRCILSLGPTLCEDISTLSRKKIPPPSS